MKRISLHSLLLIVVFVFAAEAVQAQARAVTGRPLEGACGPPSGIPTTDIDFVPEDAPHPVCPSFGPCPPGIQITTEYIGFGVDFSQMAGLPPVGVFTDPPDEWGGVNAAGDLDLLTDVWGRVVLSGSTIQGATDIIAVTAGFVNGPNDILLEAYDAGGQLVGSSIADDGCGPDDRHLAIVDLGGSPVIASFRVTTPTGDSYGVRHIWLNAPGGVPTLPSLGLALLVLLLLAGGMFALRSQRSKMPQSR